MPTSLLAAVLDYRATVVGSETPIDVCSLFEAMETPADFPSSFRSNLQKQFDRPVARPCAPRPEVTVRMRLDSVSPPMTAVKEPDWIRIDSVQRHDSTARVFLSVRRLGDAYHHETFDVVYRRRWAQWAVQQMRVWGLIYAG